MSKKKTAPEPAITHTGVRVKPATPPSVPSKQLDVFDNPAAERDYLIQFQIPEFTCHCPLTGQPDFAHFTIDMIADQLLRRAEEPEDVHVELPQRRRVPREGHQHHPRRHRGGDRAALRAHRWPSGTCAAASTPTWWPSTARRAGSRRRRCTCRACRRSRPACSVERLIIARMNPLLGKLHPYPFERLRALTRDIVPNPAYEPISLGIGEPRHPTPALVEQALTAQPGGPVGLPGHRRRPGAAARLHRLDGAPLSAASSIRRRRCCRSTARARRCSPSRRR